jgi:hypothetical protein
MAGERLGHLGHHAGTGKVGDERGSQCVKVDDAAILVPVSQKGTVCPALPFRLILSLVDPRLSRACQIFLEHFGGAVPGIVWPELCEFERPKVR